MNGFWDAMVAYPTAIYTVLLGVVLVYWLLAMLGMVDFESTGMHLGDDFHADVHVDAHGDIHADGDGAEIGTLAGYMVAFGLDGVPFSIVISLIVLIAWTLSCTAGMWLLSWVPTPWLRALFGTLTLVCSAAAALPATAALVRPMRRLFVNHTAIGNAALVGMTCRVLTQQVDERVGRAEVARRGANLNIRVWSPGPNSLQRGSQALIVAYDEASARYQIEPLP